MTETPYTGTDRSQRFVLLVAGTVRGALLKVVLLIIAPSNQFLSLVRALPARDPSGSCESRPPARRRAPPVKRSRNKCVSAIAACSRGRHPVQSSAGRVYRRVRATGR